MSFHSTTSALSAYGFAGGFGQPNWQLVQIVNSPNSNDYSYRFGASLDLSNDANYMIVGNPVYTINANGAAFVYSNSISGYSLEQQLIPNVTLSNNSEYGTNVKLDGNANIAIVGAPGYNNRGAVFIFTRSGNTWSQANVIQSSDIANGDNFGFSIALTSDANYMAVGAIGEDTGNTTNNGAVYIFTRSGNVWAQQAKILPTTRSNNGNFGEGLAINDYGNKVFIGEPNSTLSSNAGDLYQYNRTGNTWTLIGRNSVGGTPNERSCRSVTCNADGSITYTIGTDVNDFYFYRLAGISSGQTINLNSLSTQGNTLRAVSCDATGNIPATIPRLNNFGITFNQPNVLANTLQVDQLLYGETSNNQSPGEIVVSYDGNTLALGQIDNTGPPSDGKVFIYKQT